MMSRIGSLVGSVVADTTANLGFVNMALLLIHYVVAASLHTRKTNVTLEKKTLEEVKKASQQRVTSMMFRRKGGKMHKKGGGLLPPLFQGPPTTKQRFGERIYKGPALAKQLQKDIPFDGVVKGEVKVLNERVQKHIVSLLDKETSSNKIQNIVKNNVSNEISEGIKGIVGIYLDAFDHSIQYDGENAISYIKSQEPAFKNGQSYPQNIPTTTILTELNSIEPPYVLSIIARSQSRALESQFKRPLTALPQQLFATVVNKLNLAEETDNDILNIVYSVTNSFIAIHSKPNSLMGGRRIALSKRQVKEITEFLKTKRTKDLLFFCKQKSIKVANNFKKDEIIQEIIKYKKQSKRKLR
jgi:hypothetical protein